MIQLPHRGRLTHVCVRKLGHHWFQWWLVACSAPTHYLNKWWIIVVSIFRNKSLWNWNKNATVFFQENTFENDICKMSAILSQPQCVKGIPCAQRSPWRTPVKWFLLVKTQLGIMKTVCCWLSISCTKAMYLWSFSKPWSTIQYIYILYDFIGVKHSLIFSW